MEIEIMILNKPIRQFGGLYCLNDLHKASGCESRHKPAEWLRLVQTNELIKELQEDSKVGIPTLKQNQEVIHVIHGGLNRGTYACRELVLAYATWISPKFFLLVLRTFDSAAMDCLQAVVKIQPIINYLPLTPWQPTPNLPRPPRNLAEARALFSHIDQQAAQINADFHSILAQRNWISEIQCETQMWREYWQQVTDFN